MMAGDRMSRSADSSNWEREDADGLLTSFDAHSLAKFVMERPGTGFGLGLWCSEERLQNVFALCHALALDDPDEEIEAFTDVVAGIVARIKGQQETPESFYRALHASLKSSGNANR